MSGSTQFGELFLAPEFDAAVEAFLRKWIDTYLSEVELRLGYDRRSIDRPKSYNKTVSVEKWPEDQLPGILVVSAGFPEELTSLGNGRKGGWWNWVAVVLLSGRDYDATRLKTGIYQAAMRKMFEDWPDLDGAALETEQLGEPMDYAPFEGRDRTRGVVAFEMRSWIEGVVDGTRRPTDPDLPEDPDDPSAPHDDAPIVQTVDVALTKLPLDDGV